MGFLDLDGDWLWRKLRISNLIVRNDYLNKITDFKNNFPVKEDGNGWYYVVVDIKYSN